MIDSEGHYLSSLILGCFVGTDLGRPTIPLSFLNGNEMDISPDADRQLGVRVRVQTYVVVTKQSFLQLFQLD